MEQIHYIVKARTIRYSIAVQRQRTYTKKTTELEIKSINEDLSSETLTQEEQREAKRKLVEKISPRKM